MAGVLLVAFIQSLLYNVVDRITNDSVVYFLCIEINKFKKPQRTQKKIGMEEKPTLRIINGFYLN